MEYKRIKKLIADTNSQLLNASAVNKNLPFDLDGKELIILRQHFDVSRSLFGQWRFARKNGQ